MKKTSALLISFSISVLLCAQKQLTKDQEAAQQTIVKLFDALSTRDSVTIKNYSTDDVTFYEYGQVWNIDTLILKAISQNTAADFKRTNSFEFLSTTVDKSMASVTYYLHSVIINSGKQITAQWLETVVLIKERKQWKIKHLHSTLIKRN